VLPSRLLLRRRRRRRRRERREASGGPARPAAFVVPESRAHRVAGRDDPPAASIIATLRILILTPRVPWPLLDGGRIAMARLAQALAARADVRVLSLNPRKHHASLDDVPLPIEAIDIDTSRVFVPLLRTEPFIVARFVSRAFNQRLIDTLREFAPDGVQIESPFLLPYADTIRAHSDARVVLRSLNVEFRVWEELARTKRSLLPRAVARSLRGYEIRHLDTCDALIPISHDDANDFRALGCTKPIHVAPCGVPLPPLTADESEDNTVGFIGALDYLPNQQAALWIVDALWPRVLARAPHARLTISGSNPPAWLRERVHAITAPDAQQFIRSQSVMIAPLLSGGGMRIKVLEAMALGKAMVATTRGAGGIDFTPGRELVIADDADSFADAVVRLLGDRDERQRLGDAARAQVAARYDPDVIGRDLLAFYETGINASTTRANQNHARP
jgi:glycosyltransferase involved in cell wall biosynthesis